MAYIRKLESGKLLKLDSLLPFFEGQILSTKLSCNDILSLELYSLSKGESISTHNLMDQTLYIVLTGILSVSEKDIPKKSYYLVEKDTPSELFAKENTLVLIYTFNADIILKNLCFGKPESIMEKIDLVNKSVSSKIIVQKKEASLTLFSFDTEEGLSTHKAGGDAMVIPLEGEVDVMIDSVPYLVKEGDFIILPAGIPHSLIATKPYKMLLTVVKK
jgi:quercetin dioxygenase-like cupin family protein